jgi:hypothetical protein
MVNKKLIWALMAIWMAAVLGLAGCGGDGDDPSFSGNPGTPVQSFTRQNQTLGAGNNRTSYGVLVNHKGLWALDKDHNLNQNDTAVVVSYLGTGDLWSTPVPSDTPGALEIYKFENGVYNLETRIDGNQSLWRPRGVHYNRYGLWVVDRNNIFHIMIRNDTNGNNFYIVNRHEMDQNARFNDITSKDDYLYLTEEETDTVWRFQYDEGAERLDGGQWLKNVDGMLNDCNGLVITDYTLLIGTRDGIRWVDVDDPLGVLHTFVEHSSAMVRGLVMDQYDNVYAAMRDGGVYKVNVYTPDERLTRTLELPAGEVPAGLSVKYNSSTQETILRVATYTGDSTVAYKVGY